jgi:hypothetical protein
MAMLGFAFHNIIGKLSPAGVLLKARNPFDVGDIIEDQHLLAPL